MISRATPEFWTCFDRLPEAVQVRAKAAYSLWSDDPRHPGLHFKPLSSAGEGCGPFASAFIGARSAFARVTK